MSTTKLALSGKVTSVSRGQIKGGDSPSRTYLVTVECEVPSEFEESIAGASHLTDSKGKSFDVSAEPEKLLDEHFHSGAVTKVRKDVTDAKYLDPIPTKKATDPVTFPVKGHLVTVEVAS